MRRSMIGILRTAMVLSCLAATGAAAEEGSVKGWGLAGTDPSGYAIGTEETELGVSAYIRSVDPANGKFGLLMQSFEAREYWGRRMRLSATIRTDDVATYALMWMRVDREKEIVAFDNMGRRPIRGTTGWTEYAIVLDVPSGADTVMIGLILVGKGKAVWDEIVFEEVGGDVPVTGWVLSVPKSGPVNLDFDR